MTFTDKKLDLIYPILLISLILLFFIILEITSPGFFLTDDNADQYLPNFTYNWHAVIENKTIPHINFHQFLGHTYLGQSYTAVLYPPIYLAVGLSKLLFNNFFYTIDILAAMHFTIAGLGMYLLLKKLKISLTISFFCGLIWASMPYLFFMSRSVINRSFLAALLPLNFLFLENLIEKPSYKNALWLALLKMLLFFQGYIQHPFMVIQFEILYLLFIAPTILKKIGVRKIYKFVIPYLSSYFFFLLLITPQLYPMIYVQNLSSRNNVSYTDFVSNHLHLGTFFDSQIFKITSNAVHGGNSHMLYLGPFTLAIILLLPIIRTRSKNIRYRTTACFILAIIALLFTTRIYGHLYNLPFFNVFRWPHKYFSYAAFFIVITLACTTDSIAHRFKKLNKQAIHALLILILLLNILVIWQNRNSTLGYWPRNMPPTNPLTDYLDKNKGRIMTYNIPERIPYLHKYFTFNFATLFDQFHFSGYDPLISKLNHDLTNNLRFNATYHGSLNESTLKHLSKWSVRYLVTNNTSAHQKTLDNIEQLTLLHQTKDILLYENTKALPYAYYTDNPNQAVPFVFGINQIEIYPQTSKPKQLTVNIAPLPLYNYYINGKKIDHTNDPKKPITIPLPANSTKVTIKYNNRPFYLGVTIFSLFVTTIAFVNIRKLKLYKEYVGNLKPRLNPFSTQSPQKQSRQYKD